MNSLDIDIYDIIPQRQPMVMIDDIMECDTEITVTRFRIPHDCILVDNGLLTAEGMLENIAQTCAARIGFLNLQAGGNVKLGFIGGIKDFSVLQWPAAGDVIETRITVKEEIFGITLVEAEITGGDADVIAHTTMKIALSDIDARQQ